LLAATGLLPRNVDVPDWLQYGLAGYFETPYGAPYPAGGLASWSNLVAFKFYRPKLSSSREVLYNVLSDHYFHQAARSAAEAERHKENEKLAIKADEDWEKARCTAWALVYYLIQNKKFNNLLDYRRDIANLPRDLDLDAKKLEACFARAFGMSDPK